MRIRFPKAGWEYSSHGYKGQVTYKWMLSSVENIFGQEITYSYSKEGKDVDRVCNDDPETTHDVTTAIYPSEIRYANNHYRVRFQRTSDRGDQVHDWEHTNKLIFYMGSRLTTIWVEHNQDGDSAFAGAETVRKYVLTYTKDGGLSINPIFPNYTWEDGDKTLTLGKIQEYGWNGTSTLPAVTFGYTDGMHLTWADNGYGGKVEFSYTLWNDVDTHKGQTLKLAYHGNESDYCGPNYPTQTGGWGIYNGGSASCSTDKRLKVNDFSRKNFGTGMFHPGGAYLLSAEIIDDSSNGGNTAQLGLEDGSTAAYGSAYTINTSSWTTVLAVLILPANSTYIEGSTRPKYLIACDLCKIKDFEAKWLPTYYRVTAKTLRDTRTGDTSTYNYVYDGGATNDAVTSNDVATVDEFHRYYPAYSEFRGHSMVQEIGPDGGMTATFFHQDDEKKGRSSATLAGAREFWEPFDNPSTSDWSGSGWGSQQVIGLLQGDLAMQSYNSAANWNVYLTRTGNPIAEGETVLLQFMITGANTQEVLAVQSGTWGTSSYRRYGIKVLADDSVTVHSYIGTSSSDVTLVYAPDFVRDQWYVLLLAVDKDFAYLRLWKRDDPGGAVGYKKDMDLESSPPMQFLSQTWDGAVWLDSYIESKLYGLSDTLYDLDSDAPVPADTTKLPKMEGYQYWYTELGIAWVRTVSARSLDFNGDGEFSARRSEFEYNISEQGNVQYGNVTRSYESAWDGDSFARYRASKTQYYPRVNTTQYLTGLPGYSNSYKCPSELCDFGTDDTLSSVLFLYDGSTAYNAQPTVGKLTGQRSFLRWATPPTTDPRYADQQYTYDSWGNRTAVMVYTKEGTGTVAWQLASPGEQATTTTYDSTYHTYPIQVTNELGQSMDIGYGNNVCSSPLTNGYRIGVPTSIQNANDAPTSACYDVFGRMTAIVRDGNGDNATSPTVKIWYHDTVLPFWTQVDQKIDGSNTFTVRKFYNGLGQQIQSQVGSAQLTDGTCSDAGHSPDWCDVVVDSWYDDNGQLIEQSVPYAVLFGTGYRTPDTGQASTMFTYDVMGRQRIVTSPDGSSMETAYPPSPSDSTYATEILSYDQLDHPTHTFLDVWGRTGKVTPATGPGATYTYDYADHLTQVIYGTATTTLTYDNAGRKVTMDDPDMGDWSYIYDALGNLTNQTDARGCSVALTYDGLNRVTLKNYGGNCSTTTDVTYTYDQGTNGIGHRTYMSYGSDYNTTWTYDTRGRMTSETKVIGSGNTFLTQWGYNSADLVTSMTYPGGNGGQAGEVVNYTYYKQMTVDTVIGTSTYVYDTQYEAEGRVDYRKLGSSPQVQQNYVYNAWTTDGGRLSQILSGLTTDTDSLQDLRYTYDDAGNVLTIKDYKDQSNGIPQTQTFTYDNMNRLASAYAASGANGRYGASVAPIKYSYDDLTGNLESMDADTYTYDENNHPHAAIERNGWTYQYDANGNMTQRVSNGPNLAENASFETSSDWSEQPSSAFPGSSLYRSTWGTASPHGESNAYTLSNHVYGYLESDLIDIDASAQYDLYAWVKGEIDADDSSGSWIIRAYYYDSGNNPISYTDIASGGAGSLSTTYQQKGGRITTPANADKLRIQLYNYMNSGWATYDDVSLIKVGQGTNLVLNPGFESTGNWSENPSSEYPNTSIWRSNWGTTAPHGGSYAYSISNHAYGYLISDKVTMVLPNTSYDVYAYIRGEIDPDDSYGGWQIRAYYYDSSGNDLAYDVVASGDHTTINTSWQYKGGRVTTPANTAQISIMLFNYLTTGWVAFDDASLIKVGQGTNLAPNPGFESAEFWTNEGSTEFPGTSFWRSTWGTAEPHGGTYAYAISNQVYAYLQSDLINVTAGAQYDAYAYQRGETDAEGSHGGNRKMWVQFYDSSGNDLGTYAEFSNADNSGNWQLIGGRFTVPGNASKVRIKLFNYLTSGWATFDDVSLTRVGTTTYNLTYDAENRLTVVSGGATATFVYDGDGNRVKGTTSEGTTIYIGNYFEWTGSTDTMKKYYYASGERIAMRTGASTVNYLLSDHLGSNSVVADVNGIRSSEVRYKPWGEDRYSYNTSPTSFRYTGQRVEQSIGLYFYEARWYDAALGRFISADTVVPNPGDPVAWDRYAYSSGNPVKYIDPTGHDACVPKQCGYIHDNDEGWSPVKELERLRNVYGEFAEVADIEVWESNYMPEYDPYLAAAREGNVPGIWASDVMAIEIRNGFEGNLGGSARTIILNVLGGLGEGVAYTLPQYSTLAAIRNPYGRLGGPEHQSVVSALESSAAKQYGSDYYTSIEYGIKTPGGLKSTRFVDVAVLSSDGTPVAFYQVGVSTQGGSAIARERYAIADIAEYSIFDNVPITFIPYRWRQ